MALDLKESEYFAVNRTGTLLWHEVARGATRRELTDLLVARFGLSEDAAATAVEDFVADLERRSLLVAADD